MNKCIVCGLNRPKGTLLFCSKKCRNRHYNLKYAKYHNNWFMEKRQKDLLAMGRELVQCKLCDRWFVQLGTHTLQVHDLTAQEYREQFEMENKGLIPEWYKKAKGDKALENETYKNLEAGAPNRFQKGQTGVGVYKRKPTTLQRLKNLFKFKHEN